MGEAYTVAIIKDLKGRWGIRGILSKMVTMARNYNASCAKSTESIADLCTSKGVKFTFFICASHLDAQLPLIRRLSNEHEVGCHGYLHRSYTSISNERALQDIQLGWRKFHQLAVACKGFRAPYARYPQKVVPLVVRLFEYDAGMDRAESITPRRIKQCCILAVSRISDDYLFDKMQYSNAQALTELTAQVEAVANASAAIMFNLHPLRIGRIERIQVLEQLIKAINQRDGWMPTISEFIENDCQPPYDKRFTVLLTGDVDQWHFRSYFRRLI